MKKSTVIVVLLLVVLIAVFPLFLKKDAEFGGADGEAEGVISEINPEYEPWADPIMEPKSGEVESLLFALQAAIGAGVIGYYLGWSRRKRTAESAHEH